MSLRAPSLPFWLLLLAAGCAHGGSHGTPRCAAPTGTYLNCNLVERLPLTVDVSAVPMPVAGPAFNDAARYCELTAETVQSQAAAQAPLANLLRRESTARGAHNTAGAELTARVLRLAAVQQQNTAASAALQAYYRLVEAEAGAANLAERATLLDQMLADLDQLEQHDLLSPVSRSEIEDQRLVLWHQQSDVQLTIGQLNAQLATALGMDEQAVPRFWPAASLVVNNHVPDPAAAVDVALATRADLAALRITSAASPDEQLAAIKSLLQMAGSGLGQSPAMGCVAALLQRSLADSESLIRGRQLAAMRGNKQREITQQTLLAVDALDIRLRQIGTTRARLQVAQGNLAAIEEQQQLTAVPMLNVRKARLSVLAAEQDLLHDVVEWKLAEVNLQAAEGTLAGR